MILSLLELPWTTVRDLFLGAAAIFLTFIGARAGVFKFLEEVAGKRAALKAVNLRIGAIEEAREMAITSYRKRIGELEDELAEQRRDIRKLQEDADEHWEDTNKIDKQVQGLKQIIETKF